jgi:hypothetical protein
MEEGKKSGENKPKEILSRILVQGHSDGMSERPDARTFDAARFVRQPSRRTKHASGRQIKNSNSRISKCLLCVL